MVVASTVCRTVRHYFLCQLARVAGLGRIADLGIEGTHRQPKRWSYPARLFHKLYPHLATHLLPAVAPADRGMVVQLAGPLRPATGQTAPPVLLSVGSQSALRCRCAVRRTPLASNFVSVAALLCPADLD